MSSGSKILALIGLFIAAALIVFLRGPDENPHPFVQPAAPSSDNVSHAVRLEISTLQQEVEESPQDTARVLRLARLLHDGHRLEEAASYYERYVALNGADRQAWLDLANCYAGLNKWHEALVATDALLQVVPGDLEATYNLGAIHANLGDSRRAREYWEQVARSGDTELSALARESLRRLP